MRKELRTHPNGAFLLSSALRRLNRADSPNDLLRTCDLVAGSLSDQVLREKFFETDLEVMPLVAPRVLMPHRCWSRCLCAS